MTYLANPTLKVLKGCFSSFQLQSCFRSIAMANENQTPIRLDSTTMEIIEAFNLYMQQQQSSHL